MPRNTNYSVSASHANNINKPQSEFQGSLGAFRRFYIGKGSRLLGDAFSQNPFPFFNLTILSKAWHSLSLGFADNAYMLRMVHYIRLLKRPHALYSDKTRIPTVKIVVTVVTDLGDDFYHGDLTICASLKGSVGCDLLLGEWKWASGMRDLKIVFTCPGISEIPEQRWLSIVASGAPERHNFLFHKIPMVLGVSSEYSDVFLPVPASRRVQRRFGLGEDLDMVIWEGMGDSIARHIW